MINRLEAAARQALHGLMLEALGTIALHDDQAAKNLGAKYREALAEQQAAEPNAILVEGFGRVALRKLNDLREKGYAINGVSIATISEAGETNRGAVTTGGMVLWWPQQPEQQAAEPVARCPQDIIDAITAYGDARADQDAINAPTTSHERLADCIRLLRGVLTKQMAPTQQPLTVTGCSYCLNKTAYKLTPTCTKCGHDMLTATKLESAHGITRSKEGGAA